MPTANQYSDNKICTSAIIASGQTLSAGIDLKGTVLSSIIMPAVWTAADLSIKVSSDGITFVDMNDGFGNKWKLPAAAGRVLSITRKRFTGVRWLKIQSSAVQEVDRTLTLISRPAPNATRLLLEEKTFLPQLPNLTIWLDAMQYSTITKDSNDLVSQWNDKSGLGNNASQATALNKPKYVANGINGRPALEARHDGSNASKLAVPDNATLDYTQCHYFCVFQHVSEIAGSEHIVGKYGTNSNRRESRLLLTTGNAGVMAISPDGTSTSLAQPTTASTMSLGTPYIMSGSFASGVTYVRLGSAAEVTSSAAATVYNGIADFWLFSRDGASLLEPFAGRIGECLFYARKLSAAEETKVLNYLAQKWGVAL